MKRFPASPVRRSAGFTLIELMVAVVVGLIVVLAAVAFVTSVAKANSVNIQVTRLTQELRAISEVVARDLRRARYVADPVGLVGTAGANNRDAITILPGPATGSCIIFGYDDTVNPPAPGAVVSRSVRLAGSSVFVNPTGTNCSGGAAISSPEITVTQLEFRRETDSRFRITISGRLTSPPPESVLENLNRTFTQTVFVRSGEVD
jgi:prepilin-type N-terminal cleavage/methylation domain-containing protein